MLEINTGDQRYVVAYTLKPAADCVNQLPISVPIDHQPDILNTPRGKMWFRNINLLKLIKLIAFYLVE